MQRREFEGACLISPVARHNLRRSGRCISPAALANEEHVQIRSTINVITVNSDNTKQNMCVRERISNAYFAFAKFHCHRNFPSRYFYRENIEFQILIKGFVGKKQFDEKKRVSLAIIYTSFFFYT